MSLACSQVRTLIGGLVLAWLLAAQTLIAQTVADPVLNPPSGELVPVSVAITCATPEAVIRYTLDGSVPTVTAPVFYTNLLFTNLTLLRARAFKEGMDPSGTVLGYYPEPGPGSDSGYFRSVTNDAGHLTPLVTVTISASNVVCFTVEERVPAPAEAVEINSDGQWLPDLGVVRWGPFTNVPTVTLTYRVSSLPGPYTVGGVASADGKWKFEPPDSVATVLAGPEPEIPQPPSVAATPQFSPPEGANAPLDFTISSATADATIYYTLDGTVPTEASLLYSNAVHLTDAAVVRARAFKNSFLPSVASVANYGPAAAIGPATLRRTVLTNVLWAPVMNIEFTPGTNAACQAFEETVLGELAISGVSGDGLWTNGVIRWGPFFDTNGQSFSYQATGPAGTYTVRSRWSRDGEGVDMGKTNLVVTWPEPPVPVTPQKLPAPVLTPANSTNLPVTVAASCAVNGAEIRYTLDGTLPVASSPLYSGGLELMSARTLRARAFLSGWQPSDAVVGYYDSVMNDTGTGLEVVRTIADNSSTTPLITLTATPHGDVSAYTVMETLPLGLTPSDTTQNAVWNETNRTLKWGLFTNESAVMSCRISGTGGAFLCEGEASVDGYPVAVTGESNLVVYGIVPTPAPEKPPKLPAPVMTPAFSSTLPVTVSASCAVSRADLRFTVDGTIPTKNSPRFTGTMEFSTITMLRVRAFLPGWDPSDVVAGFYQPPASETGLTLTRSITNNPGYAPLVNLTATPIGNVSAYTVMESVPYGIMPYAISPAAVWSQANRTLKWGPFTNEACVLRYQVSGMSASYVLEGEASVDGLPVIVVGETNVVVDVGLMPELGAPAITLQPLSQPVAAGYDLVLYVEAVGAPVPLYQWRKDGVGIEGATSQFVRTNFQSADIGWYDVVVSNSVGVVTSQVAVVSMVVAPEISRPPQSQVVRLGQTAVFTVEANGVPLPVYQWRFNGVPLAGRVWPTLVLANALPAQAGAYDVVVSNEVRAVVSQPASLEVREDTLRITNYAWHPDGQVQFQVHAISGRHYWLQYTDNLTDPAWQDLRPVEGINGLLILSDTPEGVSQRFYRVREE